MANRNMGNQIKTNLATPYFINFYWTQAAGVALQVHNDGGTGLVTSVTRAAAGDFDVVLADNYTQLFGVFLTVGVAGAAPEDVYGQFDIGYNMAAAGGATVTIYTKTGAVDTDPADGDIVHVLVCLSNSSLNP